MEPQAPARLPVTFETGRHYKVHKSYMWLGPLVATLMVIIIVALNGAQGIVQLIIAIRNHGLHVNGLLVIVICVAAIAVVYFIVLGVYALAYKNMSYVFDELEFSFYAGIFVKRRVHLPYARVQSVNHRAGILQRIAGVCTVSIDSAGGSSNRALRIPYVRLETAERMRSDIFVRKAAGEMGVQVVYDPAADPQTQLGAQVEAARIRQSRAAVPVNPADPSMQRGAVPAQPQRNVLDSTAGALGEWRGAYGGVVAGLEPASFELRLTNRELLLTSISHSGPVFAAVIVGLVMFVSLLPAVVFGASATSMLAVLFAPIVVAAAVVTWVFGALGTAISYGGYRCCRRGTRIEVESGLLQHAFAGIDIERIQSVEVRQSLVRKLIGYCEITVGRVKAADNSGSSNKNRTASTRGLVIHPFVKVDDVERILASLLPEFEGRPRDVQLYGLPKPALRRAMLRRCVWLNAGFYIAIVMVAILAALAAVPWLAGPGSLGSTRLAIVLVLALCIAYTVGRAVGAVKWAHGSGFTWNRDYLLLKNEGWTSSVSLVPRPKIQSGYTRDNPFQRRLALTSIVATTAAGTSSTSSKLIDIPAEAGAAYLAWLEPRR